MPIIRCPHNKENPYTRINNENIFDERLSYEERGFLHALLARPDDWEFCANEMKEFSGFCKDKFYSIMSKFIDLGYAERKQKKSNGIKKNQFDNQEYIFFENPIEKTSHVKACPFPENQDTEKTSNLISIKCPHIESGPFPENQDTEKTSNLISIKCPHIESGPFPGFPYTEKQDTTKEAISKHKSNLVTKASDQGKKKRVIGSEKRKRMDSYVRLTENQDTEKTSNLISIKCPHIESGPFPENQDTEKTSNLISIKCPHIESGPFPGFPYTEKQDTTKEAISKHKSNLVTKASDQGKKKRVIGSEKRKRMDSYVRLTEKQYQTLTDLCNGDSSIVDAKMNLLEDFCVKEQKGRKDYYSILCQWCKKEMEERSSKTITVKTINQEKQNDNNESRTIKFINIIKEKYPKLNELIQVENKVLKIQTLRGIKLVETESRFAIGEIEANFEEWFKIKYEKVKA